MSDAKAKWQEANREILDRLDVAEVYVSMGVRLSAGAKARATGWLPCHAVDREDADPSAEINVGDGPARGRYRDFGGNGESLSLFDFAAKFGPYAGDWRAARKEFAQRAGVKLPAGNDGETAADRCEFFDLTPGAVLTWTDKKAGIAPEAVFSAGARGARWPKNLPPELAQHLLAFPMFGSGLLDLDPVAWHFASINGGKIRKFKGKGVQPDELKTMSLGGYGLMNVDGLRRLPEAKVVWLVEGLTDMLALASAIPADVPHVVLSAGGATYHLKAEWLHHFAGKDVRICFDAGDKDNAGQNGAAVAVGVLVRVADKVRNVVLPHTPVAEGGGKVDLRDWLAQGNSYHDLWKLSEAVEPVTEGEAAENVLQPHEALLKTLGVVVIGEHEGTQHIDVYSYGTNKTTTLRDVDRLSYAKAIQAFGGAAVKEHINPGQEPQPGKAQIQDLRNAIAEVAADKVFGNEIKIGAGVWRSEEGAAFLIVKSGSVGIWNGHNVLERSAVPLNGKKVLDLSRMSGDWYDHDELDRMLQAAGDPAWCQRVFDEAVRLFGSWHWKHADFPQLVASLVCCTWVQALWEWRPQVAVTGSSDTGKSTLMEEVLQGLFGHSGDGMSLYASKPTEAGIRQQLKHHSRAILIDEFEHDSHRQRVLEMFRASSRGSDVIRGTSDQKGARYSLRHIPWFAAIETGMRRQADRNRYIVCELVEIPPEQRGKIELPSQAELRNLGYRLLAVAVRNFHQAAKLSHYLKAKQFPGVPGRVVESFSVPCAMLSAVYGEGLNAAEKGMAEVLARRDFAGQRSTDQTDLLQAILMAEVMVTHGARLTVSQLLHYNSSPDNVAALERVGIRRVQKRSQKKKGTADFLFILPDAVRSKLLANSDHSGLQIDQLLLRSKGAKRDVQRLGGAQAFRGISIPWETIDREFEANEEDDDDSQEKQREF